METKQHLVPRIVEWSWAGALTGAAVGTVTGLLLAQGSSLRNPPILGGTIAALAEIVHQKSLDIPVYRDEMFVAILKGAVVFWVSDALGIDSNSLALGLQSAAVGGLKINMYSESK